MNTKVCIDASFVLKLVFPKDCSDRVHSIWAGWIKEEKTVVAPYLLIYETRSVVRNKICREELSLKEGIAASEVLREQEIVFYHSPVIERVAWDFAKKYDRPTLYDSLYLAVAKEIESELWTADKALLN